MKFFRLNALPCMCERRADRARSGIVHVECLVGSCCRWMRCWRTSTSWTKLLTTSFSVWVEFDVNFLIITPTTPSPLHWNTSSSSSASNVRYKQGRRFWGSGVLTPENMSGGYSMFWPLKMSHSFIQNCCCITASSTTSRMNTWTLSLHWCYHPHVWSAASRL